MAALHSSDVFVGVPIFLGVAINIASYTPQTLMVPWLLDRKTSHLVHTLGNLYSRSRHGAPAHSNAAK